MENKKITKKFKFDKNGPLKNKEKIKVSNDEVVNSIVNKMNLKNINT